MRAPQHTLGESQFLRQADMMEQGSRHNTTALVKKWEWEVEGRKGEG